MYIEDNSNEVIQTINTIHNYYDIKVAEIKKLEYERDLILRDFVRTVRQQKNNIDMYSELLEPAHKSVVTNGLEAMNHSRKLKRPKEDSMAFRLIINRIFEEFIKPINEHFGWNDDIEVVNFMSCGITTYAYAIYIKYRDRVLEFNLPFLKGIHTDNVFFANEGKISVYFIENDIIHRLLGASYDISDLVNVLINYFED